MERGELTALIEAKLGPERCVRRGDRLFLIDPAWGGSERAQAAALMELPEVERVVPNALDGRTAMGWLMIPSGGTSGKLKFARHDEKTIATAVAGYCAHFDVMQVSSVGVLPLHHVSGFMAWMRTVLTGGSYLDWEWKRLEGGEFPPRPPAATFWTLSLVPTQLQRLLAPRGGARPPAFAKASEARPGALPSQALPEAADWLRTFDAVFIGGGPSWPALLDAAAAAKLPLSLGYGMTETAAMATALRPAEFLAGERSSGAPLPHLRLDLTPEGAVRVQGGSLYRGYFPAWDDSRTLVTEDLASFDFAGRIRLLGRRDAVIITGGKKVDPVEVEAVLRMAGLFSDVAVLGVPDPEWGQRVTAFFPATEPAPEPFALERALSDLAAYKRPRRYVAVSDWPRNAQGKLVRSRLPGVDPAS
jgi:O-succinylbenzoic acid--CoA ligase